MTEYSYPWYIERFKLARSRVHELDSYVEPDLFLQPPSDGSWCMAECISHLNEFGEIYYDTISSGIEEAEKYDGTNPVFPPRLIWKGIIKLFEPPYRLKLKTVPSFKPVQNKEMDKQAVVDDFLRLQDRFISLLTDAEAGLVDLNSTKVSNPVLNFISMTLSECFAVTDAHQRRHIWQARQIHKMIKPEQ